MKIIAALALSAVVLAGCGQGPDTGTRPTVPIAAPAETTTTTTQELAPSTTTTAPPCTETVLDDVASRGGTVLAGEETCFSQQIQATLRRLEGSGTTTAPGTEVDQLRAELGEQRANDEFDRQVREFRDGTLRHSRCPIEDVGRGVC